MKQRTKARQLLQIAYATYQRNEPDIARDIFVLAMEDPTARVEFGVQTRAELTRKLKAAAAAGDYEEAAELLTAMDEMEDEPLVEEEPVDEEEMEEEAATSPGDFVAPVPEPDLAPAQVASLVTLARKIKADGHPDLAKRITRALGL